MTTSKPMPVQAVINPKGDLLFDFKTLRLVVGVIAFLLPWVATLFAGVELTSISASYHTTDRARDILVGSLSVIGILLLAYQGYKPVVPPEETGRFWKFVGGILNAVLPRGSGKLDFRVKGREIEEDLISTLGGLGAITAALFPTSCDTCDPDLAAWLHYSGAVLLFSTVLYFCVVAFLRSVASKLHVHDGVRDFLRETSHASPADKMKVLRGRIYIVCGWGVTAIMVGLLAAQLVVPGSIKTLRLTFWAEFVAMLLFGISWATASLRIFRDADESE